MKKRFSPSDGSLQNNSIEYKSDYSTERSPVTALLFDAKRTVQLPIIHHQDSSFPVEIISAQAEELYKAE